MLCISVFPAVGQYGEAYDNHMFLARFFTEPADKWLKHHFIQLALHSARKFKMDSGKRESEANLHMGQVYLEKGNIHTQSFKIRQPFNLPLYIQIQISYLSSNLNQLDYIELEFKRHSQFRSI